MIFILKGGGQFEIDAGGFIDPKAIWEFHQHNYNFHEEMDLKMTTSVSDQIETQNINKLLDLVSSCATTSMKQVLHCKEEMIGCRKLGPTEDLSYDHWICCIVVSFKELSVTFSVHFSSKTARQLTSIGTGKAVSELTPKINHDFMREYCNMTAGSIKEKLLKCDFETPDARAVMLPVQEPSFDEGGLENTGNGWISNWMVTYNNDLSLICSGKVEVENPAQLKNISKLDNKAIMIDDSGEIEFF